MRTLLAAFAFASLAASAQAASINDALAAYRQTRVGDAEAGFRAVYADPAASVKDRAAAARELARIAWLVDGDAAGAKARLAEAEAAGDDLCDTGEMKARVLREAGERAAAVVEGHRLVGYFWLVDRKAPQALGDYEDRLDRLFADGLKTGAPAGDQLALVDLLIRAGFFEAARQLAADAGLAARGGDDPRWARARRYFRFRDEVGAKTLTMNRQMARGTRPAKAYYDDLILKLSRELTGETEAEAIKAASARDFGLYGTGGETGGYPSLHLGHLFQDEKRTVQDAGRKGEVRFIVIDGMVANGFESWLWDGSAAAGGWAEDGARIIQIRPRYTLGPVRALALLGDTATRRKLLATIAEREAADRAAAAGGKVVPLAGPQRRMNLQVAEAVAAKARAKGGDFREAFLAEYWRINVEQSIFLHEGRHVFDQQAAKAAGVETITDDLEFTAKLSELRLGEVPKMSLMQIDGELVGGDSAHGRANARLMTGVRDWMQAHAGKIAGYDPGQPALLQVEKLTDAQIRAAATAMDPWFAKPN